MPVADGYKPDIGTFLQASVRNEGNAHTGSHQIQSGLRGIHSAYNAFICGNTGCPFLEALAHVVIEYNLRFMHHVLGLNFGMICQRVVQRKCHIDFPLIQLAEMQRSVPVCGIHDGHIQFFLPHHVHQIFRGTLGQMEADPLIFRGIFRDFLRHKTAQRTGNVTHTNHNRCADFAVTQDNGGRVQLLQGGADLLLIEASLIGQTNIPSCFFEEFYATQLVFQIVNGAA